MGVLWSNCIPVPPFPQCKTWMKTLKGDFLALGWVWGFIDREMGVTLRWFSPLCYEIQEEKSQPRSTFTT